MLGNSWVAAKLAASQEGLSPMELTAILIIMELTFKIVCNYSVTEDEFRVRT
jgi:hypothetical protein